MIFGKDQLVFDLSESGKKQRYIKACDVEMPDMKKLFGDKSRAGELNFPNIGETVLVRHYTNMSSRNYGVENGTYPLGSCTMKYNPKVNEDMAALQGFAATHPMQPDSTVQGNLRLYSVLEGMLCDICGMDAFTFQPSAGAHGELTGVMMIKYYHEHNNHPERDIMLIPTSAHGTNPASAAMSGFKVVEIASNERGLVDVEDLKAKIAANEGKIGGMMLTNPNTLGLFEEEVEEITSAVHDAGGLMYYDGANLNAILLQVRPGDMGFDVVHLNVHKTLSTPHGGGGPGAGPVGVKDILKPFLPNPVVKKTDAGYVMDCDRPQSIGKVRAYAGSFAIFVRTLAYIYALGAAGLKDASEGAVANANYVREKLKDLYKVPYETPAMHEAVFSGDKQKARGCSTMDVVKRLIDFGIHPPTMYFPLIVHEALMIEPTETETREELDYLIEAFRKIDAEIDENPDMLHEAPHTTPVRRPDEVKAAKDMVLKYDDRQS